MLLAFYDYPAQHWVRLRTTNTIDSTFATVRNRSKITKGPGSRAAGIAMAFRLIEAAQSRWQAVNALTASLWSVPAPASRTVNSSNDPTNQKVISTSRDKPIHRSRTALLGFSMRMAWRMGCSIAGRPSGLVSSGVEAWGMSSTTGL